MFHRYYDDLSAGNVRALARSISLVENQAKGYEDFLASIQPRKDVRITGITGPPGAGKSTLTDALIGAYVSKGQKVAVVCVDPSSPFNLGALLGDRIRMSDWYNNDSVYIRSLATRGSMGGLHPGIIEITELLRASYFDHIIVETVGVGQSEVEITGLADTTVVVLVPESGDEIQTMKAGLMEIADVFVVNKADRPEAEIFVRNLHLMMAPSFKKGHHPPEIVKTIASESKGIEELVEAIEKHRAISDNTDKRAWLLAERAFHLLQLRKMKSFNKEMMKDEILKEMHNGQFNLFSYVRSLSL
ncbi:MAG: methylmalonyl Co-A mutase-associated GTPase MeaB [Chitinophagaceae bacterium]|nr:MAG: methylmalonyl Co-A mutase-associated GTPase MeaB [Chitinophagaceae bacterium]